MNRTNFGGSGLIILAAILWAFDGILRRSLFSLPPIAIVSYEHFIGALILAPFFLARLRSERLTAAEWAAIIWVSLLSGVFGTLWFTSALLAVNFISFSVVFLLQKLQPIFAIATAKLLLKEKITREYLLWALLALVAAYFVTFKNGVVNLNTGLGTVTAAFFALGAAFAWGSSTAFSRFALLKHSGTVITGLRFFITTILAFVVYFLFYTPQLVTPTPDQTVRLLIIALSTGMVAVWFYYRGLRRTQTKIATILELIFPLTAIMIDIFLYKTYLAPNQYLAAAVLLFAIFKVSKLNRSEVPVQVARVRPGKGKGKDIGFPTLNLVIPPAFDYGHGIYAGRVIIGSQCYRAVFHFGPVPVFHQSEPSLEAHVLDVVLEEAPVEISFEMVHYLREVRQFDSLQELSDQIRRDIEQARRMLDEL